MPLSRTCGYAQQTEHFDANLQLSRVIVSAFAPRIHALCMLFKDVICDTALKNLSSHIEAAYHLSQLMSSKQDASICFTALGNAQINRLRASMYVLPLNDGHISFALLLYVV